MATNGKVENRYLLIVSLDAVSDRDVDQLLTMPVFGGFCGRGALVRQVSSVFLSNTYPAHTTVVTGCHPGRHGIPENTRPSPGDMNPDWNWYARRIKAPTIYDQARKSGYRAASVLWPVTAGAGIRYNIPEIFANRWWKNQITASLLNGSLLLQVRTLLKFGRRLKGLSQPYLDDFSCAAMCDIIKRKRPNLAMLHLTDVDAQKHRHGTRSVQASDALRRMDARLGLLFSALGEAGMSEQCSIILFGDHSMLDVNQALNFNRLFESKGLLRLDRRGRVAEWRAWLKCCGGTAFLYLRDNNDAWALNTARECLQQIIDSTSGGVKRFLDGEELRLSGFAKECPLGIEADAGYEFNELKGSHKANHGYSLKQEDYKIFYAAAGSGVNEGAELSGGCLTDIAPLAAGLLDIPAWEMDGRLLEGILK